MEPQLNNLFQDGFEAIIRYQKDPGLRKTRAEKKKEKIQKIRADLKDPVQKKQRHQIRRKQEKQKLKKQLEGLTQEEARKYLDEKGQKKRIIKQRTLKAIKTGLPIFIDLVYEDKMNQKENKSLAVQIQLIMKTIKHIDDPPGIHLCDVNKGIKTQLQRMGYQYWTLAHYQEDVMVVAQKLGKKLIYLSPDAPTPLNQIQENTAYIIGGLVDRTVIKNASLNRARQLGIEARCLPIRNFMKSRICLNLDHVVMMLCKFKQTKDWAVAFEYGAPKRWKRQEKVGNQKIQQQNDQQIQKKQSQQISNKQQQKIEQISEK